MMPKQQKVNMLLDLMEVYNLTKGDTLCQITN